MDNDTTEVARRYHNGTKHPDGDLMNRNHLFDPAYQPLLFKIYTELEPIPLSLNPMPVGMAALTAIATNLDLSIILNQAARGVPADFLNPAGATLNHLYLIVNAVEGLLPGTYVFHRDRQALELLQEGRFRQEAGYLGLGQALAADASVNIFFLTDLNPVLERFGNRGYRAAQLDASITAGRVYLAAYALHLGATGLTFFDDAVTEFFSPHAQGKSVMFMILVGSRLRRQSA